MTDLYGHRGAKGELPENSLSGFRFLAALDIHRVELDLQLSADNEIVIFHDTRLQRTTLQTGMLHSKTLPQLQSLNVASLWPSWHYIEPVPTLVEVLAAWPQLLSIQLDTKRIPAARVPLFVERLQSVLQQFAIPETIVTSEYTDILQQVKKALPQMCIGLISTKRTANPHQQALSLGCEFLIADYRQCNPEFLRTAQDAQLKVSAWTINEFSVYRQLAETNIHSIITDYPALALGWQQLYKQSTTA
jgi:glycerophosphoryl diester phosphodiesterase